MNLYLDFKKNVKKQRIQKLIAQKRKQSSYFLINYNFHNNRSDFKNQTQKNRLHNSF